MITRTAETRSGAACDNMFGRTGAEFLGRDPRLSLGVSLDTHGLVLTKCVFFFNIERG